jgi:hypothetical protein
MSRPILAALTALLIISCAPSPPPIPEFPEDVVAKVGDAYIRRGDVERMIEGMDETGLSRSKLQQEAIEELIAQELLYQEAQRHGVEISEADITSQLDLLWREFLSRAVFEQTRDENNMDDEGLRRQMERDLMIARLVNEQIYSTLTMDPGEMVTRPQEIHELYIYRRVYPGAPESKRQEALQLMREAREKVMAGEDFREVVKEYSQSGLAKYGGDAGFITYNPKSTLSRALFDLDEGHVSDIIETRWGLFILKAEEIRPERMQAFGELSPKLQRIVLQKRMQSLLDEFVKQLKQQTDIEQVS